MKLSRLVLAATLALASAGATTAFAQAKDAARDKLVADYISAFNKGGAWLIVGNASFPPAPPRRQRHRPRSSSTTRAASSAARVAV